jgi:DNA-binding response OmpR family regulator
MGCRHYAFSASMTIATWQSRKSNSLGLSGFEARACYSGESALREAAIFLPGVRLIDLNMAGMEGDALALRLK